MVTGSIWGFVKNLCVPRVACLLVASVMPHAASAKPLALHRGQLLIENFAGISARSTVPTSQQDSAQSVTDITLGSPLAALSGLRSPVAAMMTAQFRAAHSSRPTKDASARTSVVISAAIPPLARRRAQSSPMTNYNPAAGSCASYPYRPSGILKPENEAYRQLLLPFVVHEACAAGIPVGLLDALIIQESKYNALAISNKGAIGLTQLMPRTASRLGANAYSVKDNIRGGASYLRSMMNTFGGQTHLALAAYNAGPGAVVRYGGIPAYRETQGYVASILSLWGNLSQ